MSHYPVTIIDQDRYDAARTESLVAPYLDTTGLDFNGKVVMLKPSFVLPSRDQNLTVPTNTHNSVIAGVTRAILGRGAKRVLIAEHRTVAPARFSFAMVRIKAAITGIKGVECCYLDEVPTTKPVVQDPFIPGYDIRFPRMLLDGTVDYLVTLPKLKMNCFTKVSLGIKNSFGLISKEDRLKYHDADLDKHLASLYLVRKPDLAIVDAIVAGEGQGPQQTHPVPTGMLIASTNCIAADMTCCHAMGVDPATIPHVTMLRDRGLGPRSMNDIALVNGPVLDARRRRFEPPDVNLRVSPRFKVFQGQDTCHGGCLAMLRSALDQYGMTKGWDSIGDLVLVVGKGVTIPASDVARLDARKTLVFGSCAARYKNHGIYFDGCPPEYLRTAMLLAMKAKLGVSPVSRTISTPALLWHSLRHGIKKWFKI